MRNVFQRCAARAALIVPFAAVLCTPFPGWSGVLGTAESFAVLGYAGVTNAHVAGNPHTLIFGNVGVSPLTSVTGFPPGIVSEGDIFGPSSIADQALADINTAHVTLKGLLPTSNLSNQNLGGLTLEPGVYFLSDQTAYLDGTLTLDALRNPHAQFVFQLANALTTGPGSVVKVINGTAGTEVYFVLGSNASLGSSSTFVGNILAYSSIHLDPTAKIECGRAFAENESVTLIDNVISGNCTAQGSGSGTDFDSLGFSGGDVPGGIQAIPEPGSLTLLSMGIGAGFFLRRRFRSIR